MLDALKFFLFVLLLLVTILLNQHVTSKQSAELDLDLLWHIQDTKGVYVIPNQTLPSGVYTALEQSMIIGSLLEEYNDVNTSWVGQQDWIYRANLSCVASEYEYVVLTLHGVDTFADVYLGERLLGSTDNMFVRYRFDVKGQCDGSTNELRLHFRSAVGEARSKAASWSNRLPVLPECPPPVYNGQCHVNLIRKMQASFAWDWGLAAPSMGIWKPIRLEYYSSALIRDVVVTITGTADDLWLIEVMVHLEAGLTEHRVAGQLTFKIL